MPTDNTVLNAGSGGDTLRDVNRSGTKTTVVGIDLTIGGGSETLMNGSMPVTQATASALNATVVGTGTFVVQASQTGNWSVRNQDGAGNALTSATRGGERALSVQIVDGSGTQVTTFGGSGGTASNFGSGFPTVGTAVGGEYNSSLPTLSSGNMGAFQLDSSGRLIVSIGAGGGSGGTSSSFGAAFPAIGTAIGGIGSGGNLTGLNLTSGGALKVDATATTQPVSGTVTANMGTTNGLIVAQGSTTSGQSGALAQGAVTTSAPSYATGQTSPISLDTSGSQRVNVTNSPLSMAQSGTWNISQSGPWTVQPGNTPNTTPWLANPHDGTSTTGSITAVDVAVASGTGQGGQQLLSGTPTAASFVTIALTGQSVVSLQVTGSFSATLVIERSVDGGSAYVPVGMFLSGMGGVAVTSITASCVLYGHVAGATNYRVRCTAFVSGTASIAWQAGFGEGMVSAALLGSTNLIGQVSASGETGTIYNGLTASTPHFAPIVASSSGATTIVSAVGGKKIRVLRYKLSANGTVNVKWQSHVTPTDLTGLAYLVANASDGASTCQFGIFETIAGEALDINLSASVAVGGVLTYILV